MKSKPHANGTIARRAVVKGERVVILSEAEFDRLLAKADEWEPLLPAPDADGNYPAVETSRVIMAQKIIRHRRSLGLSQAELARRAGIRPESLNRIEQGRVTAEIRTIERLDRARRAQPRRTRRNRRGGLPAAAGTVPSNGRRDRLPCTGVCRRSDARRDGGRGSVRADRSLRRGRPDRTLGRRPTGHPGSGLSL